MFERMFFFAEYYHGFLSDNFDVKQHACQLLQGAIVSEQLAKLSEGITVDPNTFARSILIFQLYCRTIVA